MNFNDDGVIEPGIHTCELDDFSDTFIKMFPTSQTRKEIYDVFLRFFREVLQKYQVQEIWIDGSYATNKVNPNDMDIVIYFYYDSFVEIMGIWDSIKLINELDLYPALALCEDTESKMEAQAYYQQINTRNYWRGQFGFDRNDTPKGIIVINEEELMKIRGGDSLCQ